jgi:hypothetical protein
MEKLGIPEIQLKPTKLTFHGIVPGHSCTLMGRIELEVLFSGKDNHHHEPIWFKVVDLNSPYHALLGQPVLAKFMVVPHYAYLKMKLPGPRGVITITGCYKKSIECTRASSKLTEALVIAEEKRQLLQRVERSSRAARRRASQLLTTSWQAAPRKSRPKQARRQKLLSRGLALPRGRREHPTASPETSRDVDRLRPSAKPRQKTLYPEHVLMNKRKVGGIRLIPGKSTLKYLLPF